MNKLSIKKQKFARGLVKNSGNATKTYMQLHPNASVATANTNSSKYLKANPDISHYVVEVMNTKGVDINNLVGKLKRMTNAKKENILPSGEIIKTVDNTARMSAINTGFKLHGHLSSSVHVGNDNRTVNISVGEKSSEELSLLTDKMSALHTALALDKGQQDGEILDVDFSSGDDTSDVD